MLMKSPTQSLTEQLSARFAERIRNRLLAPGARLPSVRQCAQQNGVSPSTVVSAYDQLLAQGLVEARKNRGFFVRENGRATDAMRDAADADGVDAAAVDPALESSAANWSTAHGFAARAAGRAAPGVSPVNATALIRGMFHKISDKPQPGMGVFPADWLETTFMPSAVRKLTSAKAINEVSLHYGEPAGDAGLRQALARKLGDMGLPLDAGQIVTSVGATHALDIISRTLLRPGDPVMVEEPGWAVEFARLAALGARVLPVPRGPDGPDLATMARYCEAHRPKLYVSVSVFHNPTGYCLSPGSAHRILQLANQHNFHIVEDDTYSHIAPEHATRLSVLQSAVGAQPEALQQEQVFKEGQQVLMRSDGLGPALAVTPATDAWTRGMLVVDNVRLDALVQELGRYRSGYLGVSPEVAGLRITGSFPLHDTDKALSALLPTLPVAMEAALKCKETAAIQAEAFSGAEIKHGPMALIDDGYPLLIFAPRGPSHHGTLREWTCHAMKGARTPRAPPAARPMPRRRACARRSATG